MHYIGSKKFLLPFIEDSVRAVVNLDHPEELVFCDLFAGTGVVGTCFKDIGCRVIANDLQYYSYVLNQQSIGNSGELLFRALQDTIPQLVNANNQEERLIEVCRYLDNLQGKRGFVYKNYCCGSLKTCGFERMYFTPQNGQKCDAIRHTIEDWFKHELITREEYFYLLATLIENIDKVANTASVYGAFLKHYKKNAQKRMVMEPLSIHLSNLQHQVYCEDANELAKRISADIIYIDPPYNERQYSAYYHVLETIAKDDKPLLHGKTGLRDYNTQKSNYCYKDKVLRTFADLIANVRCQYIFVSYNSDGLMTPDEIETILRTKGDYHCFSRTYTRYRADKLDARQYKQTEVVEYIHCVVCR